MLAIDWKYDIEGKLQSNFNLHDDCSVTSLDAGSHNGDKFKWISVRYSCNKIPQSGWKLHISASLYNAPEVLQSIVPILYEYKLNFKVAGNLNFLAFLNNSPISSQQIGKFVTIYSSNDNILSAAARKLHKATVKYKSPVIKTDLRLLDGSNVYYRYGSLISEFRQTLWGMLKPIMKINGKIKFDNKKLNDEIYGQLDDPIGENKLPEQETFNFINHGIEIYHLLAGTSKSKVFLCIDRANKRRCIVKCVKESLNLDRGGKTLVERIMFEKSILQKIQHLDISPKFYSEFNYKNHYCIVLEDVPGDTLQEILNKNIYRMINYSYEDCINTSIDIANILIKLHKLNIVHGDLKLANFLKLYDGRIKLIDFDSSADFNNGNISHACGTTGFVTKNRSQGLLPKKSDDIYAFGAILYYLFGSINPDTCPLDVEQSEISLKAHNPKLPNNLITIIEDCLKCCIDDIDDIPDRLKKCQDLNHKENYIKEEVKFSEKLDFLTANYVSKSREQEGGYSFSQVLIGNIVISDMRGIAGALLGLSLTLLASNNNRNFYKKLIHEMSTRIQNEKISYNKISGLYVGESGKAISLLYSSLITNNNDILKIAKDKINEANTIPYLSVDIFNGLAGRIRANLIFYELTNNDSTYLNIATKMVNHLIDNMIIKGDNIIWYNPTTASTPENFELDYDEVCLGYAHGVAGIADVLLDYYELTLDKNIKIIINKIATMLLNKSFEMHDGNSMLWGVYYESKPILPYWCHGGAGIGLFIVRAMRSGIVIKDNSIIEKILYPIKKYTNGGAPILCHGVAGSIETLLDFSRYTGNDYSDHIHRFESILSKWLKVYLDRGLYSSNPSFTIFGYLNGVPGILALYARLINNTIPNPLSLDFAKYLKNYQIYSNKQ